MEFAERRLTQWQIRSFDHTHQHSLWPKIGTLQNVRKCESFWCDSSRLISHATHDIHATVSFTCFLGSTITCFNRLQRSPHTILPPPPTTTFESRTKCELGIKQLGETSSWIASSRSSLSTLPTKGEVFPTSSSVELNISKNDWRG